MLPTIQPSNPPNLQILHASNLPTFQPSKFSMLPTFQPSNPPNLQILHASNLPTFQPSKLPNSEDDRFLVVSKESIMTPPGGSGRDPPVCRQSAGALPALCRRLRAHAKTLQKTWCWTLLVSNTVCFGVVWQFCILFSRKLCAKRTLVFKYCKIQYARLALKQSAFLNRTVAQKWL